MPGIWSGILSGYEKHRETQETRRSEESEVARERAKQILDAVLEGTIEPTTQPSEAIVTGQGQRVQGGIGQRIMQGLGIGRPQYETGQMYRKVPGAISEQEMKRELLKREYETVMGITRPETTPTTMPTPAPITAPTPSPIGAGIPTKSLQQYIQIQDGVDKYGNPQYKTVKNPEYERWEKEQTKIMEFDVKKRQLKKDLDSFFAVDSWIKRAKGGFMQTRKAGLGSQYKAVAQPIDPTTGEVTTEAKAARTHDAARKRLRVQLVRAAGDVGNINIVEQEAAEKLIPGFYDAEGTAELKNAYLKEIATAINSNDGNAVKEILKRAGVNYFDMGAIKPKGQQPTGQLPQGITEEDIQFTMQQHRLTREEVLRRLGQQ